MRRLISVDLMRAAACLWVLLHHAQSYFSAASQPHLGPIYDKFAVLGFLGVNCFLVISGFCLFYPMCLKSDEPELRSVKEFFTRRALRILGPYYLCLIPLLILRVTAPHLFGVSELHGGSDAVAHVLMIHNLSPHLMYSVSPPFWSLALEWQFYLLFPLLVIAARRFGIWRTILAVLALSLAFRFAVGMMHPAQSVSSVLMSSVPSRLFDFVLGMGVASIVASGKRIPHAWLALVGGMVATALWFKHLAPVVWDPLWAIAFAGVLVLLIEREAKMPKIAKWASAAGVASYSLYLVHQPVLEIFQSLGGERFGKLTTPIYALCAVACAAVFFVAVERPFMMLAKRKVAVRTPKRIPALSELSG